MDTALANKIELLNPKEKIELEKYISFIIENRSKNKKEALQSL